MATSAPPDIVRSAYAELIVTDLAASKHFWVDRLGFVISAESVDALYLRSGMGLAAGDNPRFASGPAL